MKKRDGMRCWPHTATQEVVDGLREAMRIIRRRGSIRAIKLPLLSQHSEEDRLERERRVQHYCAHGLQWLPSKM